MAKCLFRIILIACLMCGCSSGGGLTMQETVHYLTAIKGKAALIPPEVLRQADLKVLIPKPFAEVVDTVKIVMGDAEETSFTPKEIQSEQARIFYWDGEPIFHGGKVVQTSASCSGKPFSTDPVLITIFLEAQGTDATLVIFYPHVDLYDQIPAEQRAIIASNMQYRGKQCLYRFSTQAMNSGKWNWLVKQD